MPASVAPMSRDELRDWIVERIAFYLDKDASSIDPGADLARYGMDSVYATSVVSDIEDHLQREVDLNAARECKTVDALADYLIASGAR